MLHIVENLDVGAVEMWLLRMYRHAHANGLKLDWTFYCALGRPGRHDVEARAMGVRVIHSPVQIGHKLLFMRALRDVISADHYDVVHSHHDLVSALYLLAMIGKRVRRRIVHVHNADESVLTPHPLKQKILRPVMRATSLALADRVVGISQHTLATFLNGRPRRPTIDRVHYYGVRDVQFRTGADFRASVRHELALPEDSRILLFAGRMATPKNPTFALEVARHMRRRDPAIVAVFAGAGPDEQTVALRARELDMESAVRILGWRDDTDRLMQAADWFILPRFEAQMEGLGLVIIEAQLAGLPMLLSEAIADDPILSTATFIRLPLAAGPCRWAEQALELARGPKASPSAIATAFAASPFTMDAALKDLLTLYNE